MNPRVQIALVLACVFALGAVVLAARGAREEEPATGPDTRFEGALMPRGVRAPDFDLRDENGEPVSMRDLRGQVAIVTFLYTTCEETCPGQAQLIKGALDELGHDVPALAIAVDPPRDTAERARAFSSEQRVIGRLRWVLGSQAELRPLWRGFAIQPQSDDREHQGRLVLVDRKGVQRVGFPLGQATPERLAHDVRLLERGVPQR